MGTNYWEVYGYYLTSPFNWFMKILPEAWAVEFFSYLVVVRVGLAGLSAFYYLYHRPKETDVSNIGFFALVFSCFYAMSGYVAAYNFNVMWLDCIILTPLILLGLERLVKDGKLGLYVISLAICIFTNFYLSIMICIFLVIYFLYLWISEKRQLPILRRFLLGSLFSGGLSAVILIPEICALKGSDFGSGSFPEKFEKYFNVMQVLARHCMGIATETELDHWPNIYCGVAVFFILPLYAVNKGIPRRKRIGFFVMMGFFLLSFELNVLDFLWHGMNFPDCLPARQSFLYILLVLIMCHDCLIHRNDISAKSVIVSYAISVCMLFVVEILLKNDDFHPGDCYITLFFVTAYAICLFLYQKKPGTRMTDWLAMISYMLVLTECTLNMSWTSVKTTDRELYYKQMQDYQTLYEEHAVTQGNFKRFEMFSNYTRNDGAILGFPSASVFASTLNTKVKDFYVKMGMRYGKVFYSYEGATALTGALLNVDYLFSTKPGLESEIYRLADEENEIYLYELKYALPFGYVAPYGFELEEEKTENGIVLQNQLAKRLGIEGDLFTLVGYNDGEGKFTCENDGFYYALFNDTNIYHVTVSGSGDWQRQWKFIKKNSILQLGQLEKEQMIHLYNTDTNESLEANTVDIYRLNMDVLKQVIMNLGKEHLTEVNVETTRVSGRLKLKKAGRLIMSIPYEKGWTVTVNNQKTHSAVFGNAWIALDLEAGEYEIVMEYHPEGKNIGSVISLISFLSCIGYYVILRLRRRNDKQTA